MLLVIESQPIDGGVIEVVVGKDEEELRDYILVMLNGTIQGTATG